MIAQETELSTVRQCAIMGVSRSGFYDWRKREVSTRDIDNIQLDEQIKRIYHEHAGR
jgi:putative transposase